MTKVKLLAGFCLIIVGIGLFGLLLMFYRDAQSFNAYILVAIAFVAAVSFVSGLFITGKN